MLVISVAVEIVEGIVVEEFSADLGMIENLSVWLETAENLNFPAGIVEVVEIVEIGIVEIVEISEVAGFVEVEIVEVAFVEVAFAEVAEFVEAAGFAEEIVGPA